MTKTKTIHNGRKIPMPNQDIKEYKYVHYLPGSKNLK